MKNIKKSFLGISLVSILFIALISILIFRYPSANEIFYKNIESIVEIKAVSENDISYGTGVIVDEGSIITNAHVVTYTLLGEILCFDEYFIRFADNEEYIKVILEKYDNNIDVAVLKTNEIETKTIKIGDSSKIDFGDKVYAMGNASNYGISITQGIISMPCVIVKDDEIDRKVIQSDIVISSGNSGGALLDIRGRLIGITTFRVKDNNGNVIYGIAYSVPINDVIEYMKIQ